MAAFFQCKQRRGFYKEVLPKWVIILPSKWIIKKIMIYYNKTIKAGLGGEEVRMKPKDVKDKILAIANEKGMS